MASHQQAKQWFAVLQMPGSAAQLRAVIAGLGGEWLAIDTGSGVGSNGGSSGSSGGNSEQTEVDAAISRLVQLVGNWRGRFDGMGLEGSSVWQACRALLQDAIAAKTGPTTTKKAVVAAEPAHAAAGGKRPAAATAPAMFPMFRNSTKKCKLADGAPAPAAHAAHAAQAAVHARAAVGAAEMLGKSDNSKFRHFFSRVNTVTAWDDETFADCRSDERDDLVEAHEAAVRALDQEESVVPLNELVGLLGSAACDGLTVHHDNVGEFKDAATAEAIATQYLEHVAVKAQLGGRDLWTPPEVIRGTPLVVQAATAVGGGDGAVVLTIAVKMYVDVYCGSEFKNLVNCVLTTTIKGG
jgi:hypothetical protein